MIEEVKIPEISENVESGTVVSVLVKVGDMIDIDDVLIEFETEKSLVDIPSTVAGKITELLAKEGEEMRVGDVIARVDTAAESAAAAPEAAEDEHAAADPQEAAAEEAPAEAPQAEVSEDDKEAGLQKTPQQPPASPAPTETETKVEQRPGAGGPAPASPSVRRFARELGVDIYDVQASGPGGRITEPDVKAHIKADGRPQKPAGTAAVAAERVETPQLPDFSRWGDIETEDLDTVRRITADNMATAWRTVPQVTQFDQADVTGLQDFIQKNADRVARHGGN